MAVQKKYELTYKLMPEQSELEMPALIKAAVRFANLKLKNEEYVYFDEIFAILGVLPEEEEEKNVD